jgi:hypothetical protein
VDGTLSSGVTLTSTMGDVGAGVFLELLARDAPVVEYERPLVEARARRAPAARTAAAWPVPARRCTCT